MNHEQRPARASHKSEKPRTPDKLERAIKDLGYVVLQCFTAHHIFHKTIAPARRECGIHENLIHAQNNASLESQPLFVRKLNEFFKHLPKEKEKPLKEHDLRAEHYTGFKSPGPFLSDQDEAEIHKRVGHITLMSVRFGEKNWGELLKGSLPIAVDRLHEFFCFLRDSYPSLSNSKREEVQSYVETLEQLRKKVA